MWLQVIYTSSELALKESMPEAIKHSAILGLAESTHSMLEVISVQAPCHWKTLKVVFSLPNHGVENRDQKSSQLIGRDCPLQKVACLEDNVGTLNTQLYFCIHSMG